MSDLTKCPKCGSSKVHQIIGSDGEVSLLCCHSCGNNEPVYHITEKGRKILETLLSPSALKNIRRQRHEKN